MLLYLLQDFSIPDDSRARIAELVCKGRSPGAHAVLDWWWWEVFLLENYSLEIACPENHALMMGFGLV